MVDGQQQPKNRGTGSSMMTNKVVFRHLPPNLTAEEFISVIGPLPEHRYFQFCKADYSAGAEASFSRAYIGLRRLDDVYTICQRFDGYEFADSKGHVYPALVEFAPNQRIPDRTPTGQYQFLAPNTEVSDVGTLKKPKKQNTLKGTLLDNDDFKVFCDQLTAKVQNEQLFSVEAMLKEIDEKHKFDEELSKKKSPLVEFLEQRKRGIMADRRNFGKSSRGGGNGPSAKQIREKEKKKKKDRRRERGEKDKKQDKEQPTVKPGSVKIAAKPSKNEDKGVEKPVHEEKSSSQHDKRGPKDRDRGSAGGKNRQAKDQRQGGANQSKEGIREKEESKAFREHAQKSLKFVEAGDEDETVSRGQSSSANRKNQPDRRPVNSQRGGRGGRRYDDNRDERPKSKETDSKQDSTGRPSSSRPASGATVGRTLAFSRSLAAATASTQQQSGSSSKPARFDPRKAPPPPGGNK